MTKLLADPWTKTWQMKAIGQTTSGRTSNDLMLAPARFQPGCRWAVGT